MLHEPTTLAATAAALMEAVAAHECDPQQLFRDAGVDVDEIRTPSARIPVSVMSRLWAGARSATGDPCIGLLTAHCLRPQSMHALGLSWLASESIEEAFSRIQRYSHIANTVLKLTLDQGDDWYKLVPTAEVDGIAFAPQGVDATLAFIVKMSRLITDPHLAPLRVTLTHADEGAMEQYVDFFRAPVEFSAPENALYFDAAIVRQPAKAGDEELAGEIDRIAERYLAALEEGSVQDQVRRLLMTLLPSGSADQIAIARHLHRSASVLRRQLKAEGTTYRQVVNDTRRVMALGLVREGHYSLGQIAYLLGFSDQASFTRAFKRWTGRTPGAFR